MKKDFNISVNRRKLFSQVVLILVEKKKNYFIDKVRLGQF